MSKSSVSHLRTRALCEGAVFLAMAVVLNFLSGLIFASLPQGGSVTLAMLPLLLYIHRWGAGRGLLLGFAYGLLELLLSGGYAWGWQSMVLDYLAAYTALGLGGFFRGRAWGIFPCVGLGCLARFLVHHISGLTLYRIAVPTAVAGLEKLGAIADPNLYSLLYNGVYMLPNTVIALVLAALLYAPLKKYLSGSDLR